MATAMATEIRSATGPGILLAVVMAVDWVLETHLPLRRGGGVWRTS